MTGTERRAVLAGARLYLLATRALSRLPLEEAVAAAMDGGVRIVQVREKGLDRAGLATAAASLLPVVRARGGLLLVNDSVEAALDAGADGAHLGPEDMAPGEARRLLGPELLLGLTTHGLAQARAAAAAGADYVGIGPVFPTATKGVPVRVIGPEGAGGVARVVGIPAFAIGGIGPENAWRVTGAGATRVAVCAAILGAGDPGRAAREVPAAWGGGAGVLRIEEA
jgi:thiamine-phosphate pyrophosphorylase